MIYANENVATRWYKKILDFFFPRSFLVKELERMRPEDFLEKTAPADVLPQIWTRSIVKYSDPFAQTLVWEIKYRGNRKLARLAAEMLHGEIVAYAAEKDYGLSEKPVLVIPVPASRHRIKERGFNQCDLITEEIQKIDGGRFCRVSSEILKKTRNTQSQTKKNRRERMKNLSGCFAVAKPEEVLDQTVIIIDDVITTGATVTEARKILLKSGAKEVTALSIAH
ncbi:MAG: phosphoribosyltransferase family protein [bacterium]|nr:phosphoribosyltransferase family protein [bacterium]